MSLSKLREGGADVLRVCFSLEKKFEFNGVLMLEKKGGTICDGEYGVGYGVSGCR